TMPSSNFLPLIVGVEPWAHIWYFKVLVSDQVVMSLRKSGCLGNWFSVSGHTVLKPEPETTFTLTSTVAGEPGSCSTPLPGEFGALTRMSTRFPGANRKLVGGL